MSIKVTEIGKLFNYGTFFDISGFDTLTLKFTAPDGTETEITDPRVSAPNVDVAATIINDDGTESQVTFPADTYMQFSALAGDFTQAGTWTVCGTYTDLTPKEFFGDEATFTVGEKC